MKATVLFTLRLGVSLFLLAGIPRPASAQEFYKGKTIRIIVGYAAGGGCDLYSRAISRYMGKRVPGNPTIFVDNMPGAGGVILANYLYSQAKPDGLTIGNFVCLMH